MASASVWHRLRQGAGLLRAAGLIPAGLVAAGLMFVAGIAGAAPAAAQQPSTPQANPATQQWLNPLPYFPLATGTATGGLTIRQHTEALKPFTVAGECGAFVGQQDGTFEAWTWPLKLLSHFTIEAKIEDYTIPINVNDQAAEIEVAPDHTMITYSHAAFTVREILFAPQCSKNGAGVMALFQVDSFRPMTLTFRFTPEVKRMWPAANYNAPTPEWLPADPQQPRGNGYYLLHTDAPDLSGAVAMPGTEPGIQAPYQERPKTWPLELVLHYDPTRDGKTYFPLLMASGDTRETASNDALRAQLIELATHATAMYQATADYYTHFFDHRLVAETPDPQLNQALKWAEISIDQLRARHQSTQNGTEVGLVAGLYNSGDSNRPGFGWYFGRDTLYTLYAVNAYGDFALTREALEFLLKRQRADGKMMHEFSQTAEAVDWKQFSYEYAAADATPLFLMAMEDYVDASDDKSFLTQHWEQVERAYNFERTHDTDGDGIYDNSQGTGWVESWPVGMPHQEVYLAALDQQASQSYGRLAALLGKTDEAQAGAARAAKISATLEQEYRATSTTGKETGAGDQIYAFSRGKDGTLDKTASIYPSVAWWGGHYELKDNGAMFRRWASHEFSTDWGVRDIAEDEPFFDPISYHQGSVWPLFTGWASVAEYRSGRSLSGYAHLMQTADLTWSQDLGAVTELLSGRYFQPLGRSTTHQLWSSSMVLTPALRGLFGLTYDAPAGRLIVDPHLPASWDGAVLHHVPAGGGTVDLDFTRVGGVLRVRASKVMQEDEAASPDHPRAGAGVSGTGVAGTPAAGADAPADQATDSGANAQTQGRPGANDISSVMLAGPAKLHVTAIRVPGELRIPLPAVELDIPHALPLSGARTTQLKVLEQLQTDNTLTLVLESQGSATYDLPLRTNGAHTVHAEGGTYVAPMTPVETKLAVKKGQPISTLGHIHVAFPSGDGYQQQTVTLHW